MGKLIWVGIALGLTGYFAGERAWHRWRDPSLRVTFFDVGQGDSALVEWPGGETWLIDAGGGQVGRDFGARVLFPELTGQGILTLDRAILSHPDQDHGLGFESLFADLSVGTFHFNRKFLSEPGLMHRLRRLALGQRISLEPVTGEESVASASLLALGEGAGRNDRTLAVSLSFGGCRLLFTGDMEKEGEAEMLRRWPGLRADLLKVPHHGSLTSSTSALLASLRPKWAVISVGKANTYGHPRPQVLERYRTRQVSVFRTDFHGYLRFRIGPTGEISCRSALGDCGESRCQATAN